MTDGEITGYLLRYLQTDPDGDLSLEATELLAAFDEDAALYALPAYAQTNFALEEIITGAQTEEAAALYHNNYRFRGHWTICCMPGRFI